MTCRGKLEHMTITSSSYTHISLVSPGEGGKKKKTPEEGIIQSDRSDRSIFLRSDIFFILSQTNRGSTVLLEG
jgi:hypothetical protein